MHTLRNEEDVYEYLYEVCSEPSVSSLGMVSRTTDSLSIGEFTVHQSLSLLYQHSTGGVVWNVTPIFAEWIRKSPLREHVHGKTVIELGSGTGALAVLLHDFVKQIVVTDQRPLLKLIRKNCAGINNVEAEEFDWETQDFHGIDGEGIVIACDTIYNDYLIDPFMNAIESVWKSSPLVDKAIIAMQLRDTQVIEKALNRLVDRFGSVDCYGISAGYIVYFVKATPK